MLKKPTAEQALEGDRDSAGRVDLGLWCAIAALVLLLSLAGGVSPQWRAVAATRGRARARRIGA